MTHLRRSFIIMSGLLFSLGCTDDSASSIEAINDASINLPEAFRPIDAAGSGPILSDSGMALAGQYGAPCASDEDCISEICVPDGQNGICSDICIYECESFPPDRIANCRSDSSRGRIEFVCYPNQDLLCEPCLDDTQCDGAPCVDTPEGQRCSRACESDENCPEEYNCLSGFCLPVSGSCDCNSSNEGATRICENQNEFGMCLGEQVCDPTDGWSVCNAPDAEAELCDGIDQNCNGIIDDGIVLDACEIENEFGACEGVSVCIGEGGSQCYGTEPEAEICDLTDNDCDGIVDEGFILPNGVYGSDEHCGRCGVSCEGRIANATDVRCDAERDTPACVALSCAPGFQLIDGQACVPLRDVTCEPCIDNDTCSSLSPGAACVPIGDPEVPETVIQVCGRDCSPESLFGEACPDGFECRAFGEAPDRIHQCLPATGHCLCRENPDGFSIPCSVNSPVNEALTCSGRRGCDGDDFGECVLPADTCDGFDNDCDGIIDNDFRGMNGRYNLDPQHCGRCNFDCAQLAYANATGVCRLDVDQPLCEMRCNDGFIDLDNGTDDGCECRIIPGDDRPNGLDQNCDGIDGDRAVALFVSKVGNDEAVGTAEAPLLTIGAALSRAIESNGNIRDVYVATGVYSENIILADGINLYGGYALGFRTRDPAEHPTTILGRAADGPTAGSVTARSLSQPTRLDGFAIYGANAAVPGANSIAVFILDSGANLTLSQNEIIAGNGGPGGRGTIGDSGNGGRNGATGTNAISSGQRNCENVNTAGGNGAEGRCGEQDVSGGMGGAGQCPQTQEIDGQTPCSSRRDDQCRNSCESSPCDPLPPGQNSGEPGAGAGDAPGGGPTYDRWSSSGICNLCGLFPQLPHLGLPGTDGPDGTDGMAGQGCSDGAGALDGEFRWSTVRGGTGQGGQAGTGGGGGSAGSGLDITPDAQGNFQQCVDTLGGGGGGGGSGGCGGGSGIGGQGGGGSFAVLVAYGPDGAPAGLPILNGNRIQRGVGGDGGSGGAGGIGGLGGEGADGGIAANVFCAEPGGRGGNGGDGGHGGGGGGGCGGISVSIYISGAGEAGENTYVDDNELIPSGRAGNGGQGGGSTGNPGTSGQDGLLSDVVRPDVP